MIYVNLIKKFFVSPKCRFIFIILIPIFITFLFLVSVFFMSIRSGSVLEDQNNINKSNVGLQKEVFDSYLDVFSRFTKLPLSFFNLNIYVFNNISVVLINKEKINTELNIKIHDKYTHAIKTGEIKNVYSGLNITKLIGSSIERSVIFEKAYSENDLIREENTYWIFAVPNISCLFLLCIALIFLELGLIFTINSLTRFIILGSPIIETLQEIESNNKGSNR